MTYRALVVEDDSYLAELYARMLQKLGFTVDIASDGQEALAYLEATPPDLMTLDINLPKLSGIDVLRHARLRLKLTDLKVIVLTANLVAFENRNIGMADAALEKPVSKETLLATCERLLQPVKE